LNKIFDGEAAHSGDEVSEGYSNSEDEVESESDRLFIKDSPATQVSQSYDQSMMYRRGLLTQAPGDGDGPAFARGPLRPKPFGRIDGPRENWNLPSSSPPPPDEDLDHYELGTFVVPDDEEISYAQDISYSELLHKLRRPEM
jgi:ATP-dependent DNA helicase MPH1